MKLFVDNSEKFSFKDIRNFVIFISKMSDTKQPVTHVDAIRLQNISSEYNQGVVPKLSAPSKEKVSSDVNENETPTLESDFKQSEDTKVQTNWRPEKQESDLQSEKNHPEVTSQDQHSSTDGPKEQALKPQNDRGLVETIQKGEWQMHVVFYANEGTSTDHVLLLLS